MRETLPQINSSSIRSPITSTRWPAKRAIVSIGIAGGFGMPLGSGAAGDRSLLRYRQQREAGPRDHHIQPSQQHTDLSKIFSTGLLMRPAPNSLLYAHHGSSAALFKLSTR